MKNFKFTVSLAVSALMLSACGASSAQEDRAAPLKQEAAAAQITAPAWNINAAQSHLKFSALQEGERFEGAFETFEGVINFDPNDLGGSYVKITVPLAGVDAGSTDRNSTLPGKVWFAAKAFPVAIYEAREFTKTDSGDYIAKGTLSLKGQSRDFDLPFALSFDAAKAVMTSKTALDRTQWNVGEAPWDTDEWVSKEVTLNIQVTAVETAAGNE